MILDPPPPPVEPVNESPSADMAWKNWLNSLYQKVSGGETGIKKEIFIDPTRMKGIGATGMVETVAGTFYVLTADDSINEEAYFSFHVPDDWKAGSDVSIHIDYMNAIAQTGINSVIFNIDYASVADGEDGTPIVTTVTVTDTLATDEVAEVMHETSPMVLSGSGLAAGDVVGCKIYRDASNVADTMTGDALIAFAHIEYMSI